MSKYGWDDDEDESTEAAVSGFSAYWDKSKKKKAKKTSRHRHSLARHRHNKKSKKDEDVFEDSFEEDREIAYEPEPVLTAREAEEAEDRGPSFFDIMLELAFRAVERAIAAIAYEVFSFFSKRRFLTPRERRMKYAVV